jgi:hypothetical protein
MKTIFVTTLLAAALPVGTAAADEPAGCQPGSAATTQAHHEMGEHPAVLIKRDWSKRGYDYASKFYLHPARLALLPEAPREMNEHPAVVVARTWKTPGTAKASDMAAHPAL